MPLNMLNLALLQHYVSFHEMQQQQLRLNAAVAILLFPPRATRREYRNQRRRENHYIEPRTKRQHSRHVLSALHVAENRDPFAKEKPQVIEETALSPDGTTTVIIEHDPQEGKPKSKTPAKSSSKRHQEDTESNEWAKSFLADLVATSKESAQTANTNMMAIIAHQQQLLQLQAAAEQQQAATQHQANLLQYELLCSLLGAPTAQPAATEPTLNGKDFESVDPSHRSPQGP